MSRNAAITTEWPWAWLLWTCALAVLALTLHRQSFLFDNLYTAARDHFSGLSLRLLDPRQRRGLTDPDRAALSDLRRSPQYESLSDNAGFELLRRKPGQVREPDEGDSS